MNVRGSGYGSAAWLVPLLLLLLGSLSVFGGVHRMLAMSEAFLSGGIGENSDDLARYLEFPVLTLIHLVPGILFMLLGPLQLLTKVRQRMPKLHRLSGRILVVSGVLVGLSAIVMALVMPPVLDVPTRVANVVFGGTLIVLLGLGVRAIRCNRVRDHRAWMIRAYAIGLAQATMRVMFMSVYAITGEFDDALVAPMVWSVFALHIVVAELAIRRFPRALAPGSGRLHRARALKGI